MKSCILFLLVVLTAGITQAQDYRAFAGAITPTSARVLVMGHDSIATLTYFGAGSGEVKTMEVRVTDTLLRIAIADLTDLKPATMHAVTVMNAAGEQVNQITFETFPLPGTAAPFMFAFGSCQGFNTTPATAEPIFAQVAKYQPKFFLECGDWGYPDFTDKYPTDSNFFAIDYTNVVEAYRRRYAGADMNAMLAHAPIDYMYDDHDYVNDNSSRASTSIYGSAFREVAFPPQARQNSMRAYQRYFPHYPLVDTAEGLHHSIRYGNVEIFVCDNRSARSPNLEAITQRDGVWYFEPPAGHSLLGERQLQWLLAGLKNSTADWKFIMTGVSFNKGYGKVVDALSGNGALQQFVIPGSDQSPMSVFGSILDTWAGFPEDQNRLMAFIKTNDLKNIVMLTSDSHTSAMDDGANSGLPEIMSGNLAQNNSRLAWFMANAKTLPIIGNLIEADLSAWNGGGQGLGNTNYNNAFARMDVFGPDSVRCQLIDENGELIASMTLCKDGRPCDPSGVRRKAPARSFNIYPNPVGDVLRIDLTQARVASAELIITDAVGRRLKSLPLQTQITEASVQDLPAGYYFAVVISPEGNLVRSFFKQ